MKEGESADHAAEDAAWSAFHDVQRIVLRGIAAPKVSYFVLRLKSREAAGVEAARAALYALRPWVAGSAEPRVAERTIAQIGFTGTGLKALGMASSMWDYLAQITPAFAMGASRRSPRLGDTGASAPEAWVSAFAPEEPDAVLSLHHGSTEDGAAILAGMEAGWTLVDLQLDTGDRSASRDGVPGMPLALSVDGQPMMDGITRPRIRGLPVPSGVPLPPSPLETVPGDYVLGRPNSAGVNAWSRGTGVAWAPGDFEEFFRDGSFSALRLMATNARIWKDYLRAVSEEGIGLSEAQAADRLLGRQLHGAPLPGVQGDAASVGDPATWDDFRFDGDPQGRSCPYASHIRRMNPRRQPGVGDGVLHPVIRRGRPYQSGEESGLLGHFFCASLDDQYEFLLHQWAQSLPQGAACRPGASLLDPFASGGRTPLPFDFGTSPASQVPLPRFVTTRGMAYLFYPSRSALQTLAASWVPAQEPPPAAPPEAPGPTAGQTPSAA